MPCGSRSDVAGAPAPELDEQQKKVMKELEQVAEFMDTSWLTLCGYGIGMDAIIGLVPAAGDCITGTISLYLLVKTAYYFPELFKKKWPVMAMNIGVDFGVGTIPIFGDIFDAGWHSNVKNVNILRKHYGLAPLAEVGPEESDAAGTREVELADAPAAPIAAKS